MKKKFEKVPAIEISKMGGLKCDNPNCDWSDINIKTEDYKMYVDYKCPKCGHNILTKKDYKAFKFMIGLIKVINFILPKRVPDKNKDAIMTCDFNGTGKVNTKIEKQK